MSCPEAHPDDEDGNVVPPDASESVGLELRHMLDAVVDQKEKRVADDDWSVDGGNSSCNDLNDLDYESLQFDSEVLEGADQNKLVRTLAFCITY